MSVTELILSWSSAKPDSVAVCMKSRFLTYRELGQNISKYARVFCDLQVPKGGIVLIFLPQGLEAINVFFGAMHMGGVPSFMPLPSSKQDKNIYWNSHKKLVALLKPSLIVCPELFIDDLKESGLDQCAPLISLEELFKRKSEVVEVGSIPKNEKDTIALLQHSSGTTSLKKGVALSHSAIMNQVESYASRLKSSSSDVVVSWLPLYHDMGLIACTVSPLMLGQKIVLIDPFEWISSPHILFEEITRHKGTLIWMPNFAFELTSKVISVQDKIYDLSSVRAFINCSEPCKPISFEHFFNKFSCLGLTNKSLQVCYAMAETVFAVSQTDMDAPPRVIYVNPNKLSEKKVELISSDNKNALKLLSTGNAINGISITICNEEGEILNSDQVGGIELSGDFLFSEYYHRPELTTEKFRGGRYRTGDLGFVYENELFVLGRQDDLLIIHGKNYFAHEIEAIVNEVKGVKPGRNVAVDVFNEKLGTSDVVLIMEVLPDLSQTEFPKLKRVVKEVVYNSMGLELRDVVIVSNGWLLKSSSGKISRSSNKQKFLSERNTNLT